MESSIYVTTMRARNFDEMIYGESKNYTFPFRMLDAIIQNPDNSSFFDDPKVNAVYEQVDAAGLSRTEAGFGSGKVHSLILIPISSRVIFSGVRRS